MDAFQNLQIERERELFVFYGFENVDESIPGAYFKQAHSLSEALADLRANDSVMDHDYVVTDLFVENDDGEVTLHVELGLR
jgi:hypothetical protein